MTLFFMEESKEQNKYKFKIDSIRNKIYEKIDGNKIFLTLPIKTEKKVKNKKLDRLITKLEKYKIKTVILSNQLYEIEILKNKLYERNINIIHGKYLLKILIEQIINYICKKGNKTIEITEVSILTNDASSINKQIIKEVAEKVKTLNIITNHIDEFKNLEDYLYTEKGIIIKLSNNCKTALNKTNIIINFDFPQELIDKYYIPNKCVVVNINGGIKIKSKKFNGICANDYNIIIPSQYKINGFNNKFIYEGFIFNMELKKAKQQILKDKIKIKNLIGEKGIINNKEFKVFP